jgi:DNA repair exonuclease SbcCD ATPase subunit
MAITKEMVFAAADELCAVGNPTIDTVRDRLGGGSYTTIGKFLREWRRDKENAARSSISASPPPSAILDPVSEAMAKAWALALEMANDRLAAEREAVESNRKEMEAANQEISILADRLTAELSEARARADNAERDAASLREEADGLRAKLSEQREQTATAQASLSELRTELDKAQKAAAKAQETATQAREKAAELRGQLLLSAQNSA